MEPESELAELRQAIEKLTARVSRLEVTHPPSQDRAPVPLPPPPVSPLPVAPPSPATDASAPSAPPHLDRDLESRIGSHWLNRIGITALLIGVAYFLKLAFDNDWIGASGRVAIGLVAGIALVLWSERFYGKGYKAFSHSLTAAGAGILYLSLWAAFQLYKLVPNPVAFFAMMAVTAFTGLLALRRDAEMIAAVALVGGFSTPILLSTGQNRPIALFTYVLLLDVATAVLVAMRPWGRLLLGSFFGTMTLYLGWANRFGLRNEDRTIAFVFSTLFFLVFAIIPLLKPIQRDWATSLRAHGLPRSLLALALLNAGVYFVQVYQLTDDVRAADDVRAFVAAGLGAFYIALASLLRRTDGESGVMDLPHAQLNPWLHLAIGLGFLTIAIPLKLHSHWITIGWLLEAAAILYVAHRAGSRFLRNAAICGLALGVFRLLLVDDFYSQHLLFNARFATYLVALAVMAGIRISLRQDPSEGREKAEWFAGIAFNALALVALGAEVRDYFARQMVPLGVWTPAEAQRRYDLTVARDFTFSALAMAYGAALMTVGFWRKRALLRWQAMVLLALAIAKVFLYDVRELSSGFRVLSFIVLGALLLAVSFAYQKDWIDLGKTNDR